MRLQRILVILILTANVVSAQESKTKYLLNWKIDTDKYIAYELGMDDIEVEQGEYNNYLSEFLEESGLGEADEFSKSFDKMIDAQKKEIKKYNNFTVLSNRNSKTYIRMIRTLKEGEKKKNSNDYILNIQTGILLRGYLNSDGSIYSNYLKSPQKNIIALFFQLPQDSVSIGDKWTIDLQWVTSDQNFICDSAFQNHYVTLLDVVEENGEQIAKLKYEIEEYINGTTIIPWKEEKKETMYHFQHIGICYFNITKGRWKTYDIINSTEMAGLQNGSQKARYYIKETELDKEAKTLIENE